jgi:hypothetical protein
MHNSGVQFFHRNDNYCMNLEKNHDFFYKTTPVRKKFIDFAKKFTQFLKSSSNLKKSTPNFKKVHQIFKKSSNLKKFIQFEKC